MEEIQDHCYLPEKWSTNKDHSKAEHAKPGTHQTDADELVATKADCGVGSRRQRLGSKLSWHTKPTLDTRRPSSTSVLRISRALVRQLNSQSEWSDGPTDRRTPTPIQHVESAGKKQTRTSFSRRRGAHWENLVGWRTKTAWRPTVGLVCTGLNRLRGCKSSQGNF